MEWAATMPIVAISEHARSNAAPGLNIVDVVHHGLPGEHFCHPLRSAEEFFVWLGRFVPEKGPHLAIEAARKAGIPLILAGTVDQHIQESVRYFAQEIEPHIDGQQIKYIGPVDMAQKIDLLSRARGLLNPIQWEEPFGMVMIEAMAAGCPIITFPRGAAPEIVSHQTNGFLVNAVDEMVHFIARIGELDRGIVQAHAARHFSVQAMAAKYVGLYQTLIASLYGQKSYYSAHRKKSRYSSRQNSILAPPSSHLQTIDQVIDRRIVSNSQPR
jgi:glycosyltransferase involved in cell wall biosynthesis